MIDVAPAFERGFSLDRFITRYVDMHGWSEYVNPDRYVGRQPGRSTPDFDMTFVEHQFLPERSPFNKWIGGESDANAPELQYGVVVIERTAFRDVEQQITILYPDVQANIATTAGHRFGRISTLARPYNVVLVD